MSSHSTYLLLFLVLCAGGTAAQELPAGDPQDARAVREADEVSSPAVAGELPEDVLQLLEVALEETAPLPEKAPALPDARTPAPQSATRPRDTRVPGTPPSSVPRELISRQLERAQPLHTPSRIRGTPLSSGPGATSVPNAVPAEASTAAARARTESSRRDVPTTSTPGPTPPSTDPPNVPVPDPGGRP